MPKPTIIYKDIDISLLANPITSDVLQKTGASAVIQSLSNLVQYGHYEKFFHPEIGANIRQLLFELPDSNIAGLIEKEIRNVINNFEPRVNLLAVAVESDQVNDGYNITIEFTVTSIPNPIQISSFLARVR